jgi:hypothetical protein
VRFNDMWFGSSVVVSNAAEAYSETSRYEG